MIRVIYISSYDAEPVYMVCANKVIKEYDSPKFVALVCEPHSAKYNVQYLDYGMEEDIIQAYVENLMESKEVDYRLSYFDHLWDYLMGEGIE